LPLVICRQAFMYGRLNNEGDRYDSYCHVVDRHRGRRLLRATIAQALSALPSVAVYGNPPMRHVLLKIMALLLQRLRLRNPFPGVSDD
jgi:hypothetical protein